ncbi:MAG: FAD-dependent oxidoreductase [Bacteroidota bacterium]
MIPTEIYDYLIVGQGLAGTLLGHELMKAGQRVLFVDGKHQGTASQVAAGIINPITGRRFVKSWMIETLLPQAMTTYHELENLLGERFLFERQIYRALHDPGEENEWSTRAAIPEYAHYVEGLLDQTVFPQGIKAPHQIGVLQHGGQVLIPRLIAAFRIYLSDQSVLLEAAFDYEDLTLSQGQVSYRDLRAKQVIFCEGFRVLQNPWFAYLHMVLAKGEVLLIEAPDLKLEQIFKKKLIYAPLGNGLFWAGATYQWNYPHLEKSDWAYEELLEKVKTDLTVDFKVVQHLAAIRPTVHDRRPLLGKHPDHPQLNVFNGLGTKGASLGPYWAKQMSTFLLGQTELPSVVDIQRFAHKRKETHQFLQPTIYKAQVRDHQTLSDITFQSKAHWGYTPQQMETWRDELRIDQKYIRQNIVYVLVYRQQMIGYYAFLAKKAAALHLDNLFVLPAFIGKGFGRQLMQHAFETAKKLRAKSIRLAADPHAVAFYEKLGFKTIDQQASSIPGRFLPIMSLEMA